MSPTRRGARSRRRPWPARLAKPRDELAASEAAPAGRRRRRSRRSRDVESLVERSQKAAIARDHDQIAKERDQIATEREQIKAQRGVLASACELGQVAATKNTARGTVTSLRSPLRHR
jgi:hypothetical protein